VAPYSGAMLAMVARSGRVSVSVPSPKNSTNLPTTFSLRSSSVIVSTRSVAVQPSRQAHITALQAELIQAGDPTARRLAVERYLADASNPLSGVSNVTVQERENAAQGVVDREARGVMDESLRLSSATLSTLSDVLRSMAPRTGRKLCLLVSDGFQMGTGTAEDREPEMRRIIDASLRSGSVVYSLTSTGLATGISDVTMPALNSQPGLDSMVDRRGER